MSTKVSFSKKRFKYHIGYKDAKKIEPLLIFLPKMTAYRKDFDEINYMCFLIKDDELFKKYHEILEKVKNSHEKDFDGKPIYNKIKSNPIMDKSAQIFTTIKWQETVLSVFAY